MNPKFEDLLGKLVISVVFALLLHAQATSVLAHVHAGPSTTSSEMMLASRVLGLIFLCIVVGFTLTRRPALRIASGLEARLSAMLGTFILMVIPVLPTTSVQPEWLVVSNVLVVIGTSLSIYCLSALGRSFSIMASARGLVMSGPYAVVRHPLYAAETVTAAGFVVANWSATAVAIGLTQFALQLRRIANEERVLASTFSAYPEYARRVPMLVPRIRARNPA